MTDRDYERMERRKKLHEKSMVTSIIAGVVIVLALIAIVIVVVALVKKNQTDVTPEPTVAVTEQPTLYRADPTEATTKPTEAVTSAPTTYVYPTEQQVQTEATAAAPTTGENATASPAEQGALYFYANGSTTYGYNWTYSGGGGIVNVTCNYDFSSAQYAFVLTGVGPGTAQVSLVYYTGDDQTVTVPMTVSVDENLKVTRIG